MKTFSKSGIFQTHKIAYTYSWKEKSDAIRRQPEAAGKKDFWLCRRIKSGGYYGKKIEISKHDSVFYGFCSPAFWLRQ